MKDLASLHVKPDTIVLLKKSSLIRLRYNPREGHDLYIVYDEGLRTYRDLEIPELPLPGIRTIMLKYSYNFIIGG